MRNFTIYLTMQLPTGEEARTELHGKGLTTQSLVSFLNTSAELIATDRYAQQPVVDQLTIYIAPEDTEPDA